MPVITTATARYTMRNRVSISCPYDYDFIGALKDAIPSRYRSWSPEYKTWAVFDNIRLTEVAVEILLAYFPDAEIEEWEEPVFRRSSPPPPPPPPLTTDPDFAVLHLLPTAPPSLVAAAYRTLAKDYHPDMGGDAEKMQQLNNAMDRLRDRGKGE